MQDAVSVAGGAGRRAAEDDERGPGEGHVRLHATGIRRVGDREARFDSGVRPSTRLCERAMRKTCEKVNRFVPHQALSIVGQCAAIEAS